jgi:asparagine synthetase B (glutamine-hydrolysing)
MTLRPTIADHVWLGPRPVIIAGTNPDEILAQAAEATGHYALHLETDDGHVLVRDPLGVNKLFFTVTASGEVSSANFLHQLIDDGSSLDRIWSVPSGHAVVIDPTTQTYDLRRHHVLPFDDGDDTEIGGDIVERIRDRLEEVFDGIAASAADRPVYVCLSGGMDSTGVAVLARRRMPGITAVTFALAEGMDRGHAATPDDLTTARRLAVDLDLRMLEVIVAGEAVVETLDDVLRYGQDWRDFNVHCGLVNEALARSIAADARARGTARPIVLTGDTMNELMADYTPVEYRGQTFYALPRLPMARLRRALVAGLDSGDREIGIFGRHGVDVIQPYALAADAYTAVPAGALGEPRSKQALAHRIFGDSVPSYVYDRPKVRAQAASEDVGGTLGLLADRGIHGAALQERFAQVLRVQPAHLRTFIRAGLYRYTTTYPASQE